LKNDFLFPLNLLDYYADIRFKDKGKNKWIYDAVRKKWVAFKYDIEKKELDEVIGVKATKTITVVQYEELVRQLLIQYLVQEKGYPLQKISLEGGVKTKNNKGRGRYDLFVFDTDMKPFLVVECKGPEVGLSPEVSSQIHGYDYYNIQAVCLAMVNGREAICYEKNGETGKPEYLSEIPDYPT
jgi:predicted transport protein